MTKMQKVRVACMIDSQGRYDAVGTNDPKGESGEMALENYLVQEDPELAPKLVYLEAMVECPGEPETIPAEQQIEEEALS